MSAWLHDAWNPPEYWAEECPDCGAEYPPFGGGLAEHECGDPDWWAATIERTPPPEEGDALIPEDSITPEEDPAWWPATGRHTVLRFELDFDEELTAADLAELTRAVEAWVVGTCHGDPSDLTSSISNTNQAAWFRRNREEV